MKHKVIITACLAALAVICIIPVKLAAQPTEKEKWPSFGRIGLSYTYQVNTTQQFNVCAFGFPLTERLIVEAPVLGFSRIIDDPYNTHSNYSFVPLVIPLLTMAALADSGRAKSKATEVLVMSLAGVQSALNSAVFYTVTGKLQNARKSRSNYIIISPFIKTETDWFIVRGNDWLQISPGAGIRAYVGKAAGLDFSAGYQRTFQTEFKGHWKKQDMLFFGVGFDVDFDSGMSV